MKKTSRRAFVKIFHPFSDLKAPLNTLLQVKAFFVLFKPLVKCSPRAKLERDALIIGSFYD